MPVPSRKTNFSLETRWHFLRYAAIHQHAAKTAARTLVTASPEPLSNIALSGTEDIAAISLTWVATHHPYAAATVAGVFLIALLLSMRWIIRQLKRIWRRLIQRPAY